MAIGGVNMICLDVIMVRFVERGAGCKLLLRLAGQHTCAEEIVTALPGGMPPCY